MFKVIIKTDEEKVLFNGDYIGARETVNNISANLKIDEYEYINLYSDDKLYESIHGLKVREYFYDNDELVNVEEDFYDSTNYYDDDVDETDYEPFIGCCQFIELSDDLDLPF